MPNQIHRVDFESAEKLKPHKASGKPVVVRVVGKKTNTLCTVDDILNASVHGVTRKLVKLTDVKTKKHHRVYASQIIAMTAATNEKLAEEPETKPWLSPDFEPDGDEEFDELAGVAD